MMIADTGRNYINDSSYYIYSCSDDAGYARRYSWQSPVHSTNRGFNMAFLDGHVQYMTPESFEALNSWSQ